MKQPCDTMESPTCLSEKYLLFTNIFIQRQDDGSLAVAPLWHKDLRQHCAYISHFHLSGPLANAGADEPLESLASLPLKVIPLPSPRSTLTALLKLPWTMVRIWKAIGQADVVHAGVAGWPIPYGWLAVPVARWRRKFVVVVVESAPWRTSGVGKRCWRAALFERLARWCVDQADIAFFTQSEYRESMLTRRRERGHVIHASWIDANRLLSNDEAQAAWREKPPGLRLLFAGRLVEAKGIEVLLHAMAQLPLQPDPITLDILGEGPLESQCAQMAKQLAPQVRIRLLGTLPYDHRFFDALRTYHALVIPSLGDEQPRIVYDAYSQAVPVIASSTAGLRDCVTDQVTGILTTPGDAQALTLAICRANQDRNAIKTMGMAGLSAARLMTHESMHHQRAKLLREALQSRRR